MEIRPTAPYSDYSSSYAQGASAQLTRGERAQSFFTQVIPNTAATYGSLASASRAAGTSAAGVGAEGAGMWGGATLGVLGGLQGAYNLAATWGKSTPAQGAANGMAVGAAVGSVVPGIGTAIGAAVGGIAGGLMGMIHSGKHKDQVARDGVREALKQQGFIDSNYQLKLADGSPYNIGIDGGPKAEFGGLRPFEINFNREFAAQAVSWMNPLADMLCGGNEKLKSDFCGYFANAAMSNATSLEDVAKNVQAIFAQFGVSPDAMGQAIESGTQQGRFKPDVGAAYMNGLKDWTSLLRNQDPADDAVNM